MATEIDTINNLFEESDAENCCEEFQDKLQSQNSEMEKNLENLLTEKLKEFSIEPVKTKIKKDKSNYVKNPKTKKDIQIDGPTYKELVAEGYTFDLPKDYVKSTIDVVKNNKQKDKKDYDPETDIFNEVTKRWCKIGSPSHKKMLDQLKHPETITERKTIKAPSGRNIIIGGKTYLLLLREGKIDPVE
jgi:hypothetical protein